MPDSVDPSATQTAQTVALPGLSTPVPEIDVIAVGAVAVALLAGGGWLAARRRRRPQPSESLRELPAPPPRPTLPTAPSEAQREAARARERLQGEAQRKGEEAERRRAEADALARSAAEGGPKQDTQAAAQLAEQLRVAKEADEERKKAEYRARKAAEVEEKERRRVEADAKAKAEAEEAQLKAEQEAALKAAEAEAQRKRVEAVAGKTLAEGLDRTRQGFMAKLGRLWGSDQKVDEKTLAELESVLFTADIGVKTAQSLLEVARERVKRNDSDGQQLRSAIRAEIERILEASSSPSKTNGSDERPRVLMVVGVNGSGKTTTIGKLAAREKGAGHKVVLAAGDTFRAAAAEQLAVWGQRSDVPVVKGMEGSDPGAVVFDAVKKAQSDGADLVICDTAGRLHTQVHLMEELKKVKRVLDKARPGAPDEILLVLDATNGQNAIAQARQFNDALQVTGIALTKLDGTAKGGVIIGICDELKIPVRYVGVGETVEDLRPFQPAEFVEALFA